MLYQESLAESIGISRQAVAKWEGGQCYPDIDKLIAISNLFKISIDKLVKDYKDNIPFWPMNYIGRIVAEGFSGDFLQ